jgi:hypothetical protein
VKAKPSLAWPVIPPPVEQVTNRVAVETRRQQVYVVVLLLDVETSVCCSDRSQASSLNEVVTYGSAEEGGKCITHLTRCFKLTFSYPPAD